MNFNLKNMQQIFVPKRTKKNLIILNKFKRNSSIDLDWNARPNGTGFVCLLFGLVLRSITPFSQNKTKRIRKHYFLPSPPHLGQQILPSLRIRSTDLNNFPRLIHWIIVFYSSILYEKPFLALAYYPDASVWQNDDNPTPTCC